jgi:amidase
MEFAASVSEHDASAAQIVREAARETIEKVAKPGSVLLLPTAPCIAPRKSASAAALEYFRVRVMRLTCIAGSGGLPQVTIPIGSLSGVPVGMSLIGWAGSDEVLLNLALSLSRLAGSCHG